ncbi:aromatic ring-hydroxylating oxygenase subunit alpha [Amycolatopsis alkalitolerans]|uniref:aromatic ring-hydroxylating oxygenase subunit alpha n=1 Tax=Amycolatopsis alkalitolerans TaxID=2547244 RepID=UPI00190F65B2|nr:aromatic ring-hydroxylating dioxygenase subunit alpha [Amycolatopsis alkalitolerans]
MLKREHRDVPEVLRRESATDLGVEAIPIDRYLSREFHELEVEKVWRKVWQMACREEQIPNVGDHVVYDIVDDSFLVVRTGPHEIKAFLNVCLHRGRRLRTEGGCVPNFRCPFHGFTWNIDGTFAENPSGWDFPQVDPERFSLPQVKVGSWGGFVFINMDRNAAPLDVYLETLPDHFKHRPLEDRYTSIHIAKIIPANWKVTAEAFLESFHLIATHPQLLGSTADESTEYTVWPDQRHISRAITVAGYSSPHMKGTDDDTIMANYLLNRQYYGRAMEGRDLVADDLKVADGQTPREFIAEQLRTQLKPLLGDDAAETATDCEILDPIAYTVFPNFAPWMAAGPSLVYRFRPNGDDHETSILDVMFLSPYPPGTERPKPAKVKWLREDQEWTDAEELGRLGPVLNQDANNIPEVQRGMKALRHYRRGLMMSRYQESRIRHFHKTLMEYINQ